MITHLFFADDSLLFCKASRQKCQKLTKILELYEMALGQKINADKSSVFFSHNAPSGLKYEVLEILGPMQDQRQQIPRPPINHCQVKKGNLCRSKREGGEKNYLAGKRSSFQVGEGKS